MTGSRRFRELVATAMVIVAVWMVVALFNASESYYMAFAWGKMPVPDYEFRDGEPPYQLWQLLSYYELTTGLLWAAFTPVIIYIAERLPLGRPFRLRNAVAVLAVTPLVTSCRAVVAGAVQKLDEGGRGPAEFLDFVRQAVQSRFYGSVLVTLAVFGVYNLLIAYRAAAASDRRLLEAKKQLANDELQRLRGAIQPRFFFGVLREVKAQMRESPVVADRTIVQFAAVLRRMLELEQHADVSLAEEFDLVERCLRLEETRTGGRFKWNIAADESLLAARVPPLVLHTITVAAVMVEGADCGTLGIEAWQSGETLNVLIRVDDQRRSPDGAVLEAARARLRRLFADRASVAARASSGREEVVLTMPVVMTPVTAGDSRSESRRGAAAARPCASV